MKQQLSKLALALGAVVMTGHVMAAGNTATADATASVTLLEPLTITAVNALRFGKIARDTAGGTGSVVIPASGTATNTGVTLVGASVQGPASFTVSGTKGATFAIAVGTIAQPGTGLTISDVTFGADDTDVSVDTTTGTIKDTGDGSGTLYMGATLTIADNAVAKTEAYEGTVPVTVTYE